MKVELDLDAVSDLLEKIEEKGYDEDIADRMAEVYSELARLDTGLKLFYEDRVTKWQEVYDRYDDNAIH